MRTDNPSKSTATLSSDEIISQADNLMNDYWQSNPDLKTQVDEKRELVDVTRKLWNLKDSPPQFMLHLPDNQTTSKSNTTFRKYSASSLDRLNELKQSPCLQFQALAELKNKIRNSYKVIRDAVSLTQSTVEPRTSAHNRKCSSISVDAESADRSILLKDQLRTWRSLLPKLIRQFSKIPDPRRPIRIEHKITLLMLYGLFAFIFKLQSRREINRELTGPLIHETLKKLFPEMDSIPHCDTLARLLSKVNPQEIEKAHVKLIRDLIRNKKFNKLLIKKCLPISIDGTQKLYRDGVMQDPRWCERLVGNVDNQRKQQYIYVLEANLTFKNGLNIPLMSEFLYRHNDQTENTEGKQDSETTAFERLALRLKRYFPRQKILLLMDAMFSTLPVMELCRENNWQFIIKLPKKKLTDYAKLLNQAKKDGATLPGQTYYRGRKQVFYSYNNVIDGFSADLNIHLVGCTESYDSVNKESGEIDHVHSDFAWISSFYISFSEMHEVINLGARKQALIEDSINTAKNRGYKYKHAFSYNLNAMSGFHYLMR